MLLVIDEGGGGGVNGFMDKPQDSVNFSRCLWNVYGTLPLFTVVPNMK